MASSNNASASECDQEEILTDVSDNLSEQEGDGETAEFDEQETNRNTKLADAFHLILASEFEFKPIENLSEVSNGFLKVLCEFILRCAERFTNYKIPSSILRQLFGNLYSFDLNDWVQTCGFKDIYKFQRYIANSRSTGAEVKHPSQLKNIILCFGELSRIETELGRDIWCMNFHAFRKLLMELDPLLVYYSFSAAALDCYVKCVNALLHRNYFKLGMLISALEFNNQRRRSKQSSRTEPYILYLTSLFLTACQRHLESCGSAEHIAEKIQLTISELKPHYYRFSQQWSNPHVLFLLQEYFYRICENQSTKTVTESLSSTLDVEADWRRLFLIYKFLSDYEVFRENPDRDKAEVLLMKLQNILESVKNANHNLTLLLPLTELSIFMDAGDDLFDNVQEICSEAPSVFPHVCRILRARGYDGAPALIFENLSAENLPILSTYDETVKLLHMMSNEPHVFGAVEDVVSKLLDIAFAALDLGRNRRNLEAWESLHVNLRKVESKPEIIAPFWSTRRHWWPKFHRLETDDDCRIVRLKCFKRLNAIKNY